MKSINKEELKEILNSHKKWKPILKQIMESEQ